MKSNVCTIEKGFANLDAILKESEKVAVYNELTHKQTMHLRLLCEDLDGMLPELIGNFEGKFWIEFEDGMCHIKVSVTIDDISPDRRKELISIAKNKKNAAAVGVVGKIRAAVESMFLNDDLADALTYSAVHYDAAAGYYMGPDYSSCWSLEMYRDTVKNEHREAEWDELEKSVIATIADDIVVGIKGRQADIIIVKRFS